MRTTTQQGLSVAFSVLVSTGIAAGVQQATEMFIPIGQSPGISKTATVIGTIESVDAEKRTIVVKSDGGTATATITEKTKIFLDGSQRKEPNRYGAFEALETGARVEVLYEGRTRATAGPAEWVKVAAGPSP